MSRGCAVASQELASTSVELWRSCGGVSCAVLIAEVGGGGGVFGYLGGREACAREEGYGRKAARYEARNVWVGW